MKKAMWRRALALAMALCMALCLMPAAFAQDEEVYIALGDSITTGYAPGDKTVDSPFAKQIADKYSLTLENYAKVGATSDGLLEQVETHKSDIAKASVVTITIGGNDLMGALYKYLAEKYNENYSPATPVTGADMPGIIQEAAADLTSNILFFAALSGWLNSFSSSQEASAAVGLVGANLQTAITNIRSANSGVRIVVATQYNPYTYAVKSNSSFTQISTAFDSGVNKLNDKIKTVVQTNNNAVVADVYTEFQTRMEGVDGVNLCNASFSTPMELDFHPNQEGHNVIAEVMGDEMFPYRATVTPASYDFGTATEGYAPVSAVTFKITNVGSQTLSNLKVTLDDNSSFTCKQPSGTLDSNDDVTFTVAPQTGLTKGTYTADVKVSADNMNDVVRTVTFTVNPKLYTLTVTGGTIEGGKTEFEAGEEVTITANQAPEGQHFAGWTFTGYTGDGTDAKLKFTMPASNVTAQATYEAHTPEADDGDCTTPILCTVCKAVVEAGHTGHQLVHHEAKAPTQTEVGWEAYDTCSCAGCNYTTYKELPKLPTYTILEGDNAVITSGAGNGLMVRASGEYSKFQSLKIDGTAVDPKNYDVKEGSTIVTLHADYVSTLSVGSHTMTFVYTDGSVDAKFTIKAAEQTGESSSSTASSTAASSTAASPQTGDAENTALYLAAALLSCAALTALAVRVVRRRETD